MSREDDLARMKTDAPRIGLQEFLESLPDDVVNAFMDQNRPPDPPSTGGGGGGGRAAPAGFPDVPMNAMQRHESQARQGAPGRSPNAPVPVTEEELRQGDVWEALRPPEWHESGHPVRSYVDHLARGTMRDVDRVMPELNRVWGTIPTALRTAVPGHDTPDTSQAVKDWWEGAGQATYSQWLREHGASEGMSTFMGALLELAEPGIGPNQVASFAKLGESVWGVIPFGRLAARTGKPARSELNRVMELRNQHGVAPDQGVGGMSNFKQSLRNMKSEFDAQNALDPSRGPQIRIHEPVTPGGSTEYHMLSPNGEAQLVMKPRMNRDTGNEELWVVALERRGGQEGAGMHPSVLSFLEFADAHDITIRTHPSAFTPMIPGGESYRRPTEQLREMYAKAGFVDDPTGTRFGTDDYRMVREPLPTDKARRKEVADARERTVIDPETGTTRQQTLRENRRLRRDHGIDAESATDHMNMVMNEFNYYGGRDFNEAHAMVNDNYRALFHDQSPLGQVLPDEFAQARETYERVMREYDTGAIDQAGLMSDLIELDELFDDSISYVTDAIQAPPHLESALNKHRELILNTLERAANVRTP